MSILGTVPTIWIIKKKLCATKRAMNKDDDDEKKKVRKTSEKINKIGYKSSFKIGKRITCESFVTA